jgi:hypothetical protein
VIVKREVARASVFYILSSSACGVDSAVHSADYSRSRDAALAVFVVASFTQTSGPPHSLDRVRTEHIWLAEVKPYGSHASMSLPVFDRSDPSSLPRGHAIAGAADGSCAGFGSRQRL